MSADNYQRSLALVLLWEGGYVNHPKDPGGATMRGITQRVYDAYRKQLGLAKKPVKGIAEAELQAIYKVQYWALVRGDLLPRGVDYAVFDIAVNSGVGRAIKMLQHAIGAKQDGALGVVTLEAVRKADPTTLIKTLCNNRMWWLKTLRKLWPTFGEGWGRRVDDVRKSALAML